MNYSTTRPPPIIYAICCTSRCGSTYLCELLSSTERLGRPSEYLNMASIGRYKGRLGLSNQATLTEYVDRLLDTYTTADTFGVKTVPEALTRLESIVLPTHYIWLRRRDTLRQAISLYRASQSGMSQRRSNAPLPESTATVPFDRLTIERVRAWIDSANDHWNERFADEIRPTLRLWYEQMCDHPQAMVEQIARFLERPLPEGIVSQSTTRVMRDELTESWMRRFAA